MITGFPVIDKVFAARTVWLCITVAHVQVGYGPLSLSEVRTAAENRILREIDQVPNFSLQILRDEIMNRNVGNVLHAWVGVKSG